MKPNHTGTAGSRTINLITMGCSKNTVDSEHLMRQFEAAGYTLIHNGEAEDARIVIVNTCGFIQDAKQESIDMILRCVEAKRQGLIDRLYVMGCLSERYADTLREEIPEVDRYFGARSLEEVLTGLQVTPDAALWHERTVTTPSHYAYLKIAEGCNRSCAFCAIPRIRGPYVSRPMEELEQEARFLADRGVKELLVIAQDLTGYGMDRYKQQMLPELVHRLCRIDGIAWIRLHYAYPLKFPTELLQLMQTEPKLCHYLDIPIQHISTAMLHKMHRHTSREKTEELLRTIRETVPDIALRTTLLVGHPGETKADFDELYRFVGDFRFDRLGVFTYSHEEETFADKNYSDDVPDKVKRERAAAIMKLQAGISEERNQARIGRTYRVIIDRLEGEYYIGRTEYDSPEVDNEVLIAKQYSLTPGCFYDVRITDASAYDLTAVQAM